MKLNHIIFFTLLVSIILSNEECQINGVKGFNFGMTIEETLNNTQVTFSTIDELIKKYSDIESESDIRKIEKKSNMCIRCVHETTFMNKSARGSLQFSDKGLYGIIYTLSLNTTNDTKYINTYFEIKSALTKKYGKPKSNEFLEYPYKDDFPSGDHAGQAISLGKGKYHSEFNCDSEKEDQPYINLILSGDNRKISLMLAYVNQNYNISKEEQEKKTLDEF